MMSELPEADRRRQIIEAALKVFSTKGFHKATNKDIAEAAGGISPGLIYHYFKDKQDLFFSILHERMQIIQLIDHPEQLLELPARAGLERIGHAYLRAMSTPGHSAVLRILMSEAMRFPQVAEMIYRGGISRVFSTVVQYIEQLIERGELRPCNPQIATRSLIGMFLAHILIRELFRQPSAMATSDDEVVTTAVSIFLDGLAAQP